MKKCIDGRCVVPGGSFSMGSLNGDADERPVRNITMTGFQLGQTEVSVGQYRPFVEKNDHAYLLAILSGCKSRDESTQQIKFAARKGETRDQLHQRAMEFSKKDGCTFLHIARRSFREVLSFELNREGDDLPVVNTTFDAKRAYCQSQGGDLPTAAQLHYASRYDSQDIQKMPLNVENYGFTKVVPVQQGNPNRFGIYHLLGNVWESSLDAYNPYFYAAMASKDPHHPLTDQSFEIEEIVGGSYRSGKELLRSGVRLGQDPLQEASTAGFRCAWPLDFKGVKSD